MNNTKKEIENLKTGLAGLKIKIRRIEDFLLCIPNSEEYIHRDDNEEDLIGEAKKLWPITIEPVRLYFKEDWRSGMSEQLG